MVLIREGGSWLHNPPSCQVWCPCAQFNSIKRSPLLFCGLHLNNNFLHLILRTSAMVSHREIGTGAKLYFVTYKNCNFSFCCYQDYLTIIGIKASACSSTNLFQPLDFAVNIFIVFTLFITNRMVHCFTPILTHTVP